MRLTMKRKTRIMRWFPGVLAAMALLLLAGCGKNTPGQAGEAGGNQQESGEPEEPQVVLAYMPETVSLGVDDVLKQNLTYFDPNSVKLIGDDLYFVICLEKDEEQQVQGWRLYRYSISDGVLERVTPVIGSYMLGRYDIGEDGSIYAADFWSTTNNGMSADSMFLTRYSVEGDILYKLDLGEVLNVSSIQEISNPVGVVADSSGEVCLICMKQVFLFDGEGNLTDRLDPLDGRKDAEVLSVGKGEQGKIYLNVSLTGAQGKGLLLEFDTKSRNFRTLSEKFTHNGNITRGIAKDFLLNSYLDTTLYDYDPATNQAEPLICWKDYGYSDEAVKYVDVTSDGRILAALWDLPGGQGNGTVSIQLFSRTLTQKKEELVLGTISPASALQDAVVRFNRSSDKYLITVKDYLSGQPWSAEAAEDAWSKLTMELAAGNGPDIIDLQAGQIPALVQQGFLEDLNPYLEQSTVIGREDFVDHVLDGALYQGKLAALPRQFQLFTVAGKISDVGADMGWTVEELIALAERHPKAQILNYPGKANLLRFSMGHNLSAFVDREAGTCSFNSPEFIRLLEFANRYGDTVAAADDFSPELYQRGDILLSEITVMDYSWIQLADLRYEGRTGIVGYPTPDGSVSNYISIGKMCGIAANSKHREGAWNFLESFVTGSNTADRWDFPALKVRLEEQVRREIEDLVYQYDENGKKILDENGQPVTEQRITHSEMFGNIQFDYHSATEAEAERTLELIRSARAFPVEDQEIQAIIDEEIEAYFGGSKSAEQVAGVIQNRVQLYLYEGM